MIRPYESLYQPDGPHGDVHPCLCFQHDPSRAQYGPNMSFGRTKIKLLLEQMDAMREYLQGTDMTLPYAWYWPWAKGQHERQTLKRYQIRMLVENEAIMAQWLSGGGL